ncbi:DUF5133 domain-containing protein [Streptomyces triticagri]|uniref:DUF5133 domain-containing protein n=1 Tax=Streptomyces triticagri TaxID=2293568 RepID=A0A372LW67_9ACTN|nr:DUF5133 domain-containing protein [Streptomyces triticagri]RFU82267.1 DUF5133 domain-containing protein [Streptomyces triticagri]
MRLREATHELTRQLEQYRTWELRFLASPVDSAIRAQFERTARELCALTGARCGREAVLAAERYLRATADGRSARHPGA